MAIALKVKDVMDKNVVSIDLAATVSEAASTMIRAKVWSLVVVGRGLPQGVVTERDIIRRCVSEGLEPKRVKVEQIMSSPLITIGQDATIREAMSTMIEKDIRRLYVVEGGRILGRVTQTHLFQSNFDLMSSLAGLAGTL